MINFEASHHQILYLFLTDIVSSKYTRKNFSQLLFKSSHAIFPREKLLTIGWHSFYNEASN